MLQMRVFLIPIAHVSTCASVSMYIMCSNKLLHTRIHTVYLSASLPLCLSASPELEKQLRTERKQTSSLKNELKTASDCSNVAEESMSRTIDKQHTKVCVCVCVCMCVFAFYDNLIHQQQHT